MGTGVEWRKSSFSGANGDCVEVGVAAAGAAATASTLVRDSKVPASPDLRFTADAWGAFLARPLCATT